jgi:hypothetical protein
MYIEGGFLAPTPRPSLIYCASPRTSHELQDPTYGGVIIVSWFHEKLTQVRKS